MMQTHFCFHSGIGEVPQYEALGEHSSWVITTIRGSVNIGLRSISHIVKAGNPIVVIYQWAIYRPIAYTIR